MKAVAPPVKGRRQPWGSESLLVPDVVNIQWIRLEEDICYRLNLVAKQRQKRPSDLVNRVVREWLRQAEHCSDKSGHEDNGR